MKAIEQLVKQKVTAHIKEKKEAQNMEKKDGIEILPGQIYYHYKNQKHLYEIIGIARHSETLKEMVVYKAIYEGEFPLGKLWVRPKRIFLQTITIDGKKMKRFTLVTSGQ